MNYAAYIKAIKPRKTKSTRLRQYQRVKDKFLPLYPTEQHDEITRAICRRPEHYAVSLDVPFSEDNDTPSRYRRF